MGVSPAKRAASQSLRRRQRIAARAASPDAVSLRPTPPAVLGAGRIARDPAGRLQALEMAAHGGGTGHLLERSAMLAAADPRLHLLDHSEQLSVEGGDSGLLRLPPQVARDAQVRSAGRRASASARTSSRFLMRRLAFRMGLMTSGAKTVRLHNYLYARRHGFFKRNVPGSSLCRARIVAGNRALKEQAMQARLTRAIKYVGDMDKAVALLSRYLRAEAALRLARLERIRHRRCDAGAASCRRRHPAGSVEIGFTRRTICAPSMTARAERGLKPSSDPPARRTEPCFRASSTARAPRCRSAALGRRTFR